MMNQRLFTILCVVMFGGCATHEARLDGRLIGTWTLEPARMIEQWKKTGLAKQDDAREFTPSEFTILKIVVSSHTLVFHFEKDSMTCSYTVLGSDADSVVVRIQQPDDAEPFLATIDFDGRGMWFPRDQGHEARAWFYYKKTE